jgi:2-polyprenyl-3-methyl-5-hydroxy-6-metoxy-1,4-benzoquinol methylase
VSAVPEAPDGYAAIYDPDADFDRHYTLGTADLVAPRVLAGQRVLELGCAAGLMTERLAATGASVVAVDREPEYLARVAARRLQGVTCRQADLARYLDAERYDHVVATNVLHELDDPARLLARARAWLMPDGLLHVSLQNPESIHRLVALEMGMIERTEDVSELGLRYATRRLWSAAAFGALAAHAGLRVRSREAVMLKPLPNALMATLPDDLIAGLLRIAHRFPEHGAINLFTCVAGDDG